MKLQQGATYLITTDNWFTGPDGGLYNAVFGTINSIDSDETILGLKTNRGSSNWYINIGNMVVAGCQVHYCIQCSHVNDDNAIRYIEHDGKLIQTREETSRIYNADIDYA